MAVAKKKEAVPKVKEAKAEVIKEPVKKEVVDSDNKPQKPLAKAGKRSAKAVEEVEIKKAKSTKKAKEVVPVVKPKIVRTRLERAGKKYREVAKLVDSKKIYSLAEAVDLAIKTSTTKFDAALELHIRLSVDPKQADQNIRGSVSLPGGTGKSIRVAVLADGADATAAKKAGADKVGSDDLFAEFDQEKIDFDILVTTPAMMPKLGKYAKLLGPKGLMPNPKSGTVTADVAKAVAESKAGKVEFRVDQAGIVHLAFGKISLGNEKLVSNAQTILDAIKSARPASLKGNYVKSIFVSSTMGPSIRLSDI